MAHALHHIHVKTRDPAASAEWWIDMFGGTRLPGYKFGTMLFTPVEFGGVRLNITTPSPGEDDSIGDVPSLPHLGLEHIGIVTEDLDADMARLRKQGLEVDGPRQGSGGYTVAFVKTPDGVTLELMQQK
jgi:catechol 2,3-dioxygenase-like lactoylglutathione lyase family enzyme